LTHFVDLSKYDYIESPSGEKCLNIGWLSKGFDFPTGEISEDVLGKLKILSAKIENETRGLHYCEFCDPPIFSPRGESFVCTLIKDAPNGNGEIWIDGLGGIKYIAPTLLLHYIEVHNYLPPKEFLEAVINA
jgi:hypothetical protein